MWFPVVLATALAATVLGQGQEEFTSDCPSPNGFFADAYQCDKYYECVDNIITEKLCPDGMAFNDHNPSLERCDFHFQVNCTERPDLQPALGDPNCPHANGYFPHPDKDKCHVGSFCHSGVSSVITCQQDLVFSKLTGSCTWPDQSGRVDCDIKAVLNFTCPTETLQVASAHPRYADPQDCQMYFVCISGVTPRHYGCKFGEVFSNETNACDAPSMVPECENYFWDYFVEYFETLGTGSTRSSTEVIEAALKSNYPVPENSKIRRNRINSANTQRKPTETSSAPASPVRSNSSPFRGSSPISPARIPIAADSVPKQPTPLQIAPKTQRPQTVTPRPQLRRTRPPGTGIRRRRPTPPTTTTPPPPTTTAPPEYYYDYDYPDYYEDEPASQSVKPAAASPSSTPADADYYADEPASQPIEPAPALTSSTPADADYYVDEPASQPVEPAPAQTSSTPADANYYEDLEI